MTNPRPPRQCLILFRHAKAQRGAGDAADFLRRLAPRGLRDAARIGKAVAALGLAPEVVLCSGATRTKETWALARDAFAPPPRVLMRRDLYLADAATILAAIAATAADATTLMVIGHNPGLQDLAVQLAGSGSPALRKQLAEKFPTAAVAVIAFDAPSWAAIGPASGRLVHLLSPRGLGDDD